MSTITIPNKLIAGDTYLVEGSLDDYSAAEYELTMVLTGAEQMTVVATADGTDYQILAAAAVTAGYAPGIYDYVLYVQDIVTGLIEYSVDSGQITIEQRADVAGIGDKRTHPQKVLASIEAVIEKRATKDQSSYSIGGRSLSRMTVEELLQFRNYYKQRVLEAKGKSKPRIKRNWLR